MNKVELVNAVIQKTNRPDMDFTANGGSGEIVSAVEASTLKMHTLDFFFRDIQTARIKFDNASYIQTIDERALPHYRNMAYIKKWDPSFAIYDQDPTLLPPLIQGVDGYLIGIDEEEAFFKFLSPTYILDGYGAKKNNVAYQAGDTLFLRSNTSFSHALAGWYTFPDVSDTTFNSWVAQKFPWAIIFDAISNIFQSIGQLDASRKYDGPGGLIAGEVARLQASNILVQGY